MFCRISLVKRTFGDQKISKVVEKRWGEKKDTLGAWMTLPCWAVGEERLMSKFFFFEDAGSGPHRRSIPA